MYRLRFIDSKEEARHSNHRFGLQRSGGVSEVAVGSGGCAARAIAWEMTYSGKRNLPRQFP